MLLCLSSLSKDASLMAVKGAPSSSCNLISFNATTCFVKLENEIEDFDVLPTVPKFLNYLKIFNNIIRKTVNKLYLLAIALKNSCVRPFA